MLSVVGTPIGNLGDLSPRAAAALCGADLVACEDTRRTATLLRHAGAGAPMVALHAHNEAARTAELVRRMAAGESVALVSDAGMPGVSDPGTRLVAAASAAGIAVTVLPGPSAVTAAVALAGLGEGAGFVFLGFLPRRAGERAALAAELERIDRPAVAFESPHRLAGSLAALAAHLPERPAVVCRELTKRHEEVLRGTLRELAGRLDAAPKGEVVLVVGPAGVTGPGGPGEDALREGLSLMLASGMGAGRAAEAAAALGAASRNRAYELALEIAAATRADT